MPVGAVRHGNDVPPGPSRLHPRGRAPRARFPGGGVFQSSGYFGGHGRHLGRECPNLGPGWRISGLGLGAWCGVFVRGLLLPQPPRPLGTSIWRGCGASVDCAGGPPGFSRWVPAGYAALPVDLHVLGPLWRLQAAYSVHVEPVLFFVFRGDAAGVGGQHTVDVQDVFPGEVNGIVGVCEGRADIAVVLFAQDFLAVLGRRPVLNPRSAFQQVPLRRVLPPVHPVAGDPRVIHRPGRLSPVGQLLGQVVGRCCLPRQPPNTLVVRVTEMKQASYGDETSSLTLNSICNARRCFGMQSLQQRALEKKVQDVHTKLIVRPSYACA